MRTRRSRFLPPVGLGAALALLVFALAAPAARAASIDAAHGAVAAEHRLASEAGVEILRKGGNAVDAAVAAALATGVVNPSSSGLGGGGFVVLWDAGRKKAFAIDFREAAPHGASEAMYVRADGSVDSSASKNGPLAVGVPGEPRGFELALKKHGKLKLADVAAPAIRLARDGFPVEEHLATMIAANRQRLAADPALAKVFLHADGSPVKAGEVLKRPELAATLERLATEGVDDFYEGRIAADIVRAAPPISAKDLKGYRAIERDPLSFRYRGLDVVSMPPPSSGGPVLAEALGILSAWDFSTIDPHGVAWAHLVGESLKATFADRATFYGDPDFVEVPTARLVSAAHAAELRAKIDLKRAVPSTDFAPRIGAATDAGTSHISVVDADGNAAALTTSVNTGFGAGVGVPGRDIVLNNTMDDFSAQPGKPNAFGLVGSRANAIAPGKRPLSSMTPTIVLRDGQVTLVAGASGGPLIITSTLETLMGVVDFHEAVDTAVSAPRIHHQWLPDVLGYEAGLPDATVKGLGKLGHKTAQLPAKASVQAIGVEGSGDARVLHATSDPRKGGVPAGY